MVDNPFAVLERRLNRIESLLLEIQESKPVFTPAPADEFLSLKDAAQFLGVAPQTMYQNIKKLPHMKRFGKLTFKRSELIAYLEEGATPGKKKGGKQ